MKQRLRPLWRIIAVQIASMALVFLIGTNSATADPNIWITSGLRANNGQIAGIFGAKASLNEAMFLYLGADLAGTEGGAGLKPMYKIPLSTKSILWLHLGGQIERVETDPDPETIVNYLMGSTGATFQYQITPINHFWVGFDFLAGTDKVKPWKFGIGIVSAFDL